MTTYRDDGIAYRDDGTPVYPSERRIVEPVIVRRRRGGGFLIGFLLLLAIIVFLLFYTGFWSMNVSQPGALPKVSINGTAGVLPKVDLESKKIVIGSKKEVVAVPTIGTRNSKDDSN